MPDVLPYVFITGLGLAVGSFLNVVVFRFGFAERSEHRSHCMACGEKIAPYDLVPLLSYVVLGGRCRHCKSRLSAQYPLLEAGVAVLFVLAYAVLPPSLSFSGMAAFTSLLVFLATLAALVTYDIRHTLLPMPFIYAAIGSAITYALAQSLHFTSHVPLIDGIIGAASLGAFFLFLYFITRGKGMGAGDIYIALACGMLLGFTRGVEAVMLAFWIGTLVMVPVAVLSSLPAFRRLLGQKGRVTMKTELPFIPFFALGICAALFTDLSPLAFGTVLVNTLWQHGI